MKRLTMPRTPEDDATRDLYKLLYTNEENTNYEDVKQCIDRGAKLRDIEASYGSPLILAMGARCPIAIIKLIVDSGGADMNYKSVDWSSIYIYDSDYIIDVRYMFYRSIYNELLLMYHTSIRSRRLENQVIDELYKQDYISKTLYFENEVDYINSEYQDYIKQCCQLLNVDYKTLKDGMLELPPGLQDISKMPNDNHPYNWNYDKDVYYIENNIEEPSDEW